MIFVIIITFITYYMSIIVRNIADDKVIDNWREILILYFIKLKVRIYLEK